MDRDDRPPLAEALRWLDRHVNLEAIARDAQGEPIATAPRAPTLDRIRALTDLMGDPQHAYPVLHLTGTNGKTSTGRILAALLSAMGLSVGTYSSPHLERINERITRDLDPIPDADLADVLAAMAELEPLVDGDLSHFEILTAAAFRWFADVAVDAAVVEVGMGGRWDATNVADGQVAVVTNVALDHTELLGPTREDIAREKSGIVKPGSTLVLGEEDDRLLPIFAAAGAERMWLAGPDFGCDDSVLAVGGRVLRLRTPGAVYDEVFLPLHGPHQAANAACALAAAEAFFGQPLPEDAVTEGMAAATSPGRIEVVGRAPLTLLDGAHNPAGMSALADAVEEGFTAVDRRVLVVGMLRGRDAGEMLRAVDADRYDLIVACAPPWVRAMPAEEVAEAARRLLGPEVEVAPSVPAALQTALQAAREEDLVLVTGSLYLVGAARPLLRQAFS